MKTSIFKTSTCFLVVQSVLIVILLNNNYMKRYSFLQSEISDWLELLLGLIIVFLNLVAVVVIHRLYISSLEAERLKSVALKYENMIEQNQLYRQHHHDLKNHLTVILGLSSQKKDLELDEYLESYLRTVNDALLKTNSGSDELDALLSAKIRDAKRSEIEVNLTILDTLQCNKKNILDLVAIIGNVIDNAHEAVRELEPSQRQVTWSLRKDPVDYIFEFSNPISLTGQITENHFFMEGVSTKSGNRGHGLLITKKLTEKLEGKIAIDTAQGQFKVIIEIPRYRLER